MSRALDPNGIWLWDNWSLKMPTGWLLYYLWAPRDVHPDERHHIAQLGSAFSDDGVHWREFQSCFAPGTAGCWDDLAIWSGCTRYFPDHEHSPYWLYYTARSQDQFYAQHIGLAHSQDGLHWERLKQPVLSPDGQYYAQDTCLNSRDVFPAFRDPDVFALPPEICQKYALKPGSLGMLFSAREAIYSQAFNACVGWAISEDGIHWQLQPPLLAPRRYDEMEMAQVLYYQGHYYLLFSCFGKHYSPDWQAQQGKHSGLHVYVAPEFEGPYLPANIAAHKARHAVIWSGEQVYAVKAHHEKSPGHWALRGFLNQNHVGEFEGGLSPTQTLILGPELRLEP